MNKKAKKTYKKYPERVEPNRGFRTPNQLCLDVSAPGFFFGDSEHDGSYIGMPQGTDGNILVLGGNGSGKSSGIVKPTLQTWRGAICATDIKGELSEHYAELSRLAAQRGLEMRPCIIFDPTQPDSLGYDPFWWLAQDGEVNLDDNIMDIVNVIVPEIPNDNQPFWIKGERAVLESALRYYFRSGLDFSEAVCALLDKGVTNFSVEVGKSGYPEEKMPLGQIVSVSGKTQAAIDFGLRSKLYQFATNPYIQQAFRGEKNGAKCFHWDDLERANIFFRIPQNKVDQWGCAINLMYAQLIRYLEKRPDRYSDGGADNVQTLLLMDEFPRLGKLDLIEKAVPTLRSKNVNVCLVAQSLAQLDMLYGVEGRRNILDNCQYQAILRANDADTQQTLCQLIGTTEVMQESASRSLDSSGRKTGYSTQRTLIREPKLFSHQLATMNDVVLLSPYGSSLVKKHLPGSHRTGSGFNRRSGNEESTK